MARGPKVKLPPREAFAQALRRNDLQATLSAYLEIPSAEREDVAPGMPALVRSAAAHAARGQRWELVVALAKAVVKAPELLTRGRTPEEVARDAWPLLWAAATWQRHEVAAQLLPHVLAWLDGAHPTLARAAAAWVRTRGAPGPADIPEMPEIAAVVTRPLGKDLRAKVPPPATPEAARGAVAALYAALGWEAVVDVLGFQWLTRCEPAVADALRREAVRWGLHAALRPDARGRPNRLDPLLYAAICARRMTDKAAVRDDVVLMLRLALSAQAGAPPRGDEPLREILRAATSDPALRELARDLTLGLAPPSARARDAVELLCELWDSTRDPRLWLTAAVWWHALGQGAPVEEPYPGLVSWAAAIAEDLAFWQRTARDASACELAVHALLHLISEEAAERFIERCWDVLDERSKRAVASFEAAALDADHGVDLELGPLDNPFARLAGLFERGPRELSPQELARLRRLSPRMLHLHEAFLLAELRAARTEAAALEVTARFYRAGGHLRVAARAVAEGAFDNARSPVHVFTADLLQRRARDVAALATVFDALLDSGAPRMNVKPVAAALVRADEENPGPRSPQLAETILEARSLAPKPRASKPRTAAAPKAPKAPKAARTKRAPALPAPATDSPPGAEIVRKAAPRPRGRGGT